MRGGGKRQRHKAGAGLDVLIRRFSRQRVLVIGDLMLDQFIWGRVERISPEAPVPVVHVARESLHLGGAANVVHNIRALGGGAVACGVIGCDPWGRRIVAELERIGAGTSGVAAARGAVTACKTRVIAHNQQVVRFDREAPPDGRASAKVMRYLRRHVWDFAAVVLSDYGKGVVTNEVLSFLREARRRRPFLLVVDPKKANFHKYRGMTLAAPNSGEAAEAAGIDIHDEQSLCAAGRRLLEQWEAEAVLVTRGEQGMALFTGAGDCRHFPTVARQVFDVTGAGDTVVGACALALASGAGWDEAAQLANHAAGIVVGKVGTATVSQRELRAAIERK